MSRDPAPTTGVAGRYAAALFDLAKEAGAVESVEAELAALKAAIAASPDLQRFIASPIYDRAEQVNVVEALAREAGFSPLVTNFLKLVASNRRLSALEGIIGAYFALTAEARGEASAEAVSAAPLNDDQIKALRLEIEKMIGKAVNLETSVDPELLGGLIVKIGSRMVDSTLRTKLTRLRTRMKEA